jgi:hypothetical protein
VIELQCKHTTVLTLFFLLTVHSPKMLTMFYMLLDNFVELWATISYAYGDFFCIFTLDFKKKKFSAPHGLLVRLTLLSQKYCSNVELNQPASACNANFIFQYLIFSSNSIFHSLKMPCVLKEILFKDMICNVINGHILLLLDGEIFFSYCK